MCIRDRCCTVAPLRCHGRSPDRWNDTRNCCPVAAWLRNGPRRRWGPSLGRATVQRRGSRTAVALLPCCSVATQRPRRRWGPSLGRATVQRRGSRTAVALLQRGYATAPPEVGAEPGARNSATPWQSYRRCPVALLPCCSVATQRPAGGGGRAWHAT